MNYEIENPSFYKKHIPTPEPATYGLIMVLAVICLVLVKRMKDK